MRILFVNVIDPKNSVHAQYYPLSFGYLVSYAKEYGCTFENQYLETGDNNYANDVLAAFKPHVVAMTSVTETYNKAIIFAHFVKHFMPQVKVVIGGIHISSVPKSLSPEMDIGIVGEGEQTFLELLQNNFEPTDTIKGLVYWKDKILVLTAERELIEPLDLIPHPDRSIFGAVSRQTYLFTSRGCTYNCIFCSSNRFWKKVRFHSATYIAEEVEQLVKQGYDFIDIYDDCFPLDMSRVRQVRNLVKGLNVKFNLSVRANLVNDEMAEVLKDMNVVTVGMGLESNSLRILSILKKGNTPDDNQRAIDILRNHGIKVHCSFIRRVPTETKSDLKLTYDFIKKNKLSYDMYNLVAFPNTPLYDGSQEWNKCQIHNNNVDNITIRMFRKLKRIIYKRGIDKKK